jgi:hypothetical protein
MTLTTVSIVRAKANIRNGTTIRLTDEKMNPPMHAKAKKTNVPVTHIAIAFKLVSVVTKRIKIYFINKAIRVKYQ